MNTVMKGAHEGERHLKQYNTRFSEKSPINGSCFGSKSVQLEMKTRDNFVQKSEKDC
jgi:hypothetical protein